MKKSMITGLALGAIALGAGFAAQPANASAAYRTIKTKSYASTTPAYHAKSATKSVYLWNSTLTKKQHNLKNYPKTTWYVQKSVKLTNGKKTGIFYYVKNKSNSASGYVWRSYLSKGKFTSATTTKTTDTNIDYKQETLSLFPGTTQDTSLQKIADTNSKIIGSDSYDYFQSQLPKNEQSNFVLLSTSYDGSLDSAFNKGELTFTQYATQNINKALSDSKEPFYESNRTIADFSGWKIAIPQNDNSYNMFILLTK